MMFRSRRGFTILETSISLGLLAAGLIVWLPLLHSAGRARLTLDQDRLAQSEAANILERLTQLPYDRLTPEAAQVLRLSDAARRELPHAELRAVVLVEPGEPARKKLTVEIQWQPGPGRKSPLCRFVTWVYRQPEAAP